MFVRQPNTEAQRLRWLTLCDLVDNGVYANVPELLEAVRERGFPIRERTLKMDLYACNIGKMQGIYARLPIGSVQEAETLFQARMLLFCSSVLRNGDIVVINTVKGVAEGVAFPLREMRDPNILSVLVAQDALWVLAAEGEGEAVEAFILEKWRVVGSKYSPKQPGRGKGAPTDSKGWPGNAWERTRRADE